MCYSTYNFFETFVVVLKVKATANVKNILFLKPCKMRFGNYSILVKVKT